MPAGVAAERPLPQPVLPLCWGQRSENSPALCTQREVTAGVLGAVYDLSSLRALGAELCEAAVSQGQAVSHPQVLPPAQW